MHPLAHTQYAINILANTSSSIYTAPDYQSYYQYCEDRDSTAPPDEQGIAILPEGGGDMLRSVIPTTTAATPAAADNRQLPLTGGDESDNGGVSLSRPCARRRSGGGGGSGGGGSGGGGGGGGVYDASRWSGGSAPQRSDSINNRGGSTPASRPTESSHSDQRVSSHSTHRSNDNDERTHRVMGSTGRNAILHHHRTSLEYLGLLGGSQDEAVALGSATMMDYDLMQDHQHVLPSPGEGMNVETYADTDTDVGGGAGGAVVQPVNASMMMMTSHPTLSLVSTKEMASDIQRVEQRDDNTLAMSGNRRGALKDRSRVSGGGGVIGSPAPAMVLGSAGLSYTPVAFPSHHQQHQYQQHRDINNNDDEMYVTTVNHDSHPVHPIIPSSCTPHNNMSSTSLVPSNQRIAAPLDQPRAVIAAVRASPASGGSKQSWSTFVSPKVVLLQPPPTTTHQPSSHPSAYPTTTADLRSSFADEMEMIQRNHPRQDFTPSQFEPVPEMVASNDHFHHPSTTGPYDEISGVVVANNPTNGLLSNDPFNDTAAAIADHRLLAEDTLDDEYDNDHNHDDNNRDHHLDENQSGMVEQMYDVRGYPVLSSAMIMTMPTMMPTMMPMMPTTVEDDRHRHTRDYGYSHRDTYNGAERGPYEGIYKGTDNDYAHEYDGDNVNGNGGRHENRAFHNNRWDHDRREDDMVEQEAEVSLYFYTPATPLNTPSQYPHNTSSQYPHNTSSQYPHNTPSQYPHNTSSQYPHNTSSQYPHNTPSQYPHNTPSHYLVKTTTANSSSKIHFKHMF